MLQGHLAGLVGLGNLAAHAQAGGHQVSAEGRQEVHPVELLLGLHAAVDSQAVGTLARQA